MQLGAVLQQIQRLYSGGSAAGLSDASLLDRFASERDEDAFAALVARHGLMVLCVCRGLVREQADAEDAFQATFRILARRVRSLRVQGSLGGFATLRGLPRGRSGQRRCRAATVARAAGGADGCD